MHTQLTDHLIEFEYVEYEDEMAIEGQPVQAEAQRTQKIRVGVIMGGHAPQLSLESGRAIAAALSPHAYQAVPLWLRGQTELYQLDIQALTSATAQKIEQTLNISNATHTNWHALPHLVDFACIALHDAADKDGTTQNILELIGLPYNGSNALTSALCSNNAHVRLVLKRQGFDVPTQTHTAAIPGIRASVCALGNEQVRTCMPAIPLPPHMNDMVRATCTRVFEVLGARGYACIECVCQDEHTSPTGTPRVIICAVDTMPAFAPDSCLLQQTTHNGIRPTDLVDLIIELGFQEHIGARPRSAAWANAGRRPKLR